MHAPPASGFSRREFLRLTAAAAAASAASAGGTLARAAELLGSNRGRPLGVALLGLGYYSRGELAPALKKTKLCRLTGVVSGHPEKAAAWAREFQLPEKNLYSYETMDQMIDNPAIDIVYVVTPPGLHRPFVERAARAGKHVISEKPLAPTVADCDAMIAACRAAKVKFSVGYRMHFDPYDRELMRLARDQDFGVLKKMSGDRGFVMGKHAWRVEKQLAGGGPMMDLGIYLIQGAIMAQAEATPVAVTARELPKARPEFFSEVEEAMAWTMEFANGAKLDAVSSYNHSADSFRAEGDRGWIEYPENAFNYRGIQCRTSRGPVHYAPVPQQALQLDDFAECILTGRDSPVPGEMGRRDIRILRAIYEAAGSGGRVMV